MSALVGLDVGTSGVKALAVSAEGEVLARAEETVPALDPPSRLGRAGPGRLVARRGGRARGARRARRRGHRALRPDARPRRPGRCRPRPAARDPLERPAHGRRVRRDRSAPRPRAARRSDREPRSDRLHGAEAPLAAPKRPRGLPPDREGAPAQGLRAPAPDGRSGHGRGRRVGDTALRRRREALERRDARGAGGAGRMASGRARVARGLGRTAAGVPVAAGSGDQAAGALGVGVDRPGRLSVALGTSGVVFAALPEYAADPAARVHVFCHAVPGRWHAMGVMLSAAGSLAWLHERVAPESYERLLNEAERWPPGAEGLLFAPYLAGERTPHADPDARGAFVGLSLRHDRGALVRAVLEGVAFGLRDSLDLLVELGLEPEAGRVSGGGARSELWLRIVASVLGLPLEKTAVEEGAAYGAALLGGVAGGVFADTEEAVASCVNVRETIEPDPAWRETYERELVRFRRLYPALREVLDTAPGRAQQR